MSDGCLALVPLRSLRAPKTRLSTVLTPDERTELVVGLADAVIGALGPTPLVVLTDDDEVQAWCDERGVDTVQPRRGGLNEAITAGRDHAHARGHTHIAVVPADLARPGDLVRVISTAAAATDTVSAVADRHADGTNVLIVPSAAAFRFAYGPGSFRAHRAEAERLGLPFVDVRHDELCWDVDTPDDLAWYRSHR